MSTRYIATSKGLVQVHSASQARWVRMEDSGPDRLTRERWEQIRAAATHCAYCGQEMTFVTMDHVVPLSRGGKHIESNVTTCCESCNTEKGNCMPDDYLEPYWWREEQT